MMRHEAGTDARPYWLGPNSSKAQYLVAGNTNMDGVDLSTAKDNVVHHEGRLYGLHTIDVPDGNQLELKAVVGTLRLTANNGTVAIDSPTLELSNNATQTTVGAAGAAAAAPASPDKYLIWRIQGVEYVTPLFKKA